jgi:hypothetical protein
MHETGFTRAWVSHDADNCYLTVFTATLLCLLRSVAVVLLLYVCSILHAICSVLDQYMFHYCIMLLLNHVILKLNNPTFHQTL